MTLHVVDASAVAALLFGEPKAEQVSNTLTDSVLAAPSLLWFEVSSVCLKKILAYPGQARQLLTAFELFGAMAIDAVEVNHAQVVRMARQLGLTTYDTSYLWLAEELGAQLVTLDEKLRKAAGSLKLG